MAVLFPGFVVFKTCNRWTGQITTLYKHRFEISEHNKHQTLRQKLETVRS